MLVANDLFVVFDAPFYEFMSSTMLFENFSIPVPFAFIAQVSVVRNVLKDSKILHQGIDCLI